MKLTEYCEFCQLSVADKDIVVEVGCDHFKKVLEVNYFSDVIGSFV